MQASPSNPELAILRGGVEGFYTGYQTNLFSKSKNHVIQGDLSDCLKPDVITGAFTNSKVVATIGPSCQSTDVMLEMLRSGMVGARIDLTWGSLEFHHESFRNLQTAMVAAKALCCTIVDTQGREIMVRHDMNPDVPAYDTHDAPFSIATGDVVTLTTRTDIEGQANTLNVNYGNLHEMCEPGDILYIGRYLVCGAESASLYLQVTSVEASGDVLCVAQNEATMEGMLTLFHVERSVFGVSNRQNTLPLFTDRDKFCIEQLKKEFDIDFLCLSYVRDSSDVLAAREYLDSIGLEDTRLLAKISTRHSLYEFQGILNTADGIVLSRGSLGLDNHPEKMAILQKMVVKACNLVGKPVLITRLVDTMITAPRPTRAEATDVANAVLDGADGFILGAETYRGHAPADTVKMIANICRSAELVFDHKYHCEHLMEAAHGISGEGGSKTHPALNRRTPQHGGSSDSLPGRAAAHYGSAPPPAPLESSKPHEPSRLGGGGVVKKVGSAKGLRSIDQSAKNMATFGMGGSFGGGIDGLEAATGGLRSKNATSNLEAMCSSAVRCADKVKAGLIIVYTHTGETAQLVAK
ncbi:hypothetical protein FOA52_007259 [Chlamydomonas sp. UWO 241]|nr:hypothetical protein FOA52_007259 [Chlamydomonas sp. UWO 241]